VTLPLVQQQLFSPVADQRRVAIIMPQGNHADVSADELDAKKDLAYRSRSMTELMIAARDGELRTAASLIRVGAEINARSKKNLWEWDRTALMYAAEGGHTPIVRALIAAGADCTARDRRVSGEGGGKTALHYAAAGGHKETLGVILDASPHPDHRDDDGATPLMLASEGAHSSSVELLLARGADVNAQNTLWGTALTYAVSALGSAPLKEIKRTISLLLRAGANPNVVPKDYGTALMNAASSGSLAVVRMLVEAGADVNTQDPSGDSALMRAVVFPGHLRVVEYLLEHGADPELKDCDGCSALDRARRKVGFGGRHKMRQICELLEARPAKRH
jgi:ankyrin repeat protein